MKRKIPWWLSVLIVGVVVLLLIQLVPYGRSHTNPPIVNEPTWDTPVTQDLVTRACLECHSNRTHWPWYSNIAPASWLAQRDVDEGREELNFSNWPTNPVAQQGLMESAVEVIREGEMPPIQFTLLHPEAKLNETDKALLIQGLLNSAAK
jgi:hypothetical protein